MHMYKTIENAIKTLAKNMFLVNTFMVVISLIFILLDSMGYSANLSGKTIRSFGKAMGKLTIIVAGFAFLNYVLREIYMKLRKEKIVLSKNIEAFYRSLMTNTHQLHPVLGVIAIYLAILHGYFIWLRESSGFDFVILFGIAAFILLLILLYVGQKIRLNVQNKQLRSTHKVLGFLFFLLYILHISLK
jgi:hypothetical protein